MLVVVNFDGRINAAADSDILHRAVLARDLEREVLLRFDVRVEADDVVGLGAVELQGLRGGAFLELQRQHAHANEVAAMDAFEALRHDSLDAQQIGSFRRPIARRAGAVFLAGQNDERRFLRLIFYRGVVDADLFAGRLQLGHAAFHAGHHQVFDADVGKGATRHHPVVAAARAVAIEIFHRDAVLDEIFSSGRRLLERAGWRNVIGRTFTERLEKHGQIVEILAVPRRERLKQLQAVACGRHYHGYLRTILRGRNEPRVFGQKSFGRKLRRLRWFQFDVAAIWCLQRIGHWIEGK